MSDEEDMGDSLKVKTPVWRGAELSALVKDLDRRIDEANAADGRQVLRKKRVVGESPMKRRPLKKYKFGLVDEELSSTNNDEE